MPAAETPPWVWGLVVAVILVVAAAVLFFWRGKGLAPLNPLAAVSLLAGIAAVLVGLLFSYLIGGLLGLAAVYLGNSGRQSRAQGGAALAIAGMALGGFGIVMYIAGRLIG